MTVATRYNALLTRAIAAKDWTTVRLAAHRLDVLTRSECYTEPRRAPKSRTITVRAYRGEVFEDWS